MEDLITMKSKLRIVSFAAMLLVCLPGGSQQKKPSQQAVSIIISAVPPTGSGSPTVTHPIAGKARAANISSCHVVIFAHSDTWYVQPTADRPLTDIGDDGTWNTSTHPGDHYAALLVCGAYSPPASTDSLPSKDKTVVAIDIRPKL
jgi:hypothetical protein